MFSIQKISNYYCNSLNYEKNCTSERCQNNNLKAIIAYSKFLGPSISFYEVENKNQVISF